MMYMKIETFHVLVMVPNTTMVFYWISFGGTHLIVIIFIIEDPFLNSKYNAIYSLCAVSLTLEGAVVLY